MIVLGHYQQKTSKHSSEMLPILQEFSFGLGPVERTGDGAAATAPGQQRQIGFES
jgi:hypothetical protein